MVSFHFFDVPVLHISFLLTVGTDSMLPFVGPSLLPWGKGANMQSTLITGQYILIRFTNKSFAI